MRATATNARSSADYWLGVMTPVILLIWIVPAVLLRAWVLTALWAWYVMPGFGVSPLHMSIAFGLSVLIALAIPRSTGKDDKGAWQIITASFVNPLMSLLMGWIGSFFV